MEVSSQDPPLRAMDLSKGYSPTPLTRSHTEAMDLAKKPEWYHRRPSCSTETSSPFRSRGSSSYNSLPTQLHPEPVVPVHHRDLDQRPEALGNYMNSSLTRGLDLYHGGVHGNLWHSGFYGSDQTGGPVPESSGGEESDSGSDVIFLVSSVKEPLLCSSFIQDGHIVEPLSPAGSSLEEGRACYHLPQPLSSPSPDSSCSEDSSDSSVEIPVHHTRPIVLLSDLSVVHSNPADSADISSDDSDVIEVSVTTEKKKSSRFPGKTSLVRETPPQSEKEKYAPRQIRRSTRSRKSASEAPPLTCSMSRHSLSRRAKSQAVGIYNESCDSDDVMEYAVRLSSSDAEELHRESAEAEKSVGQTHRSAQKPHRQGSKSLNRERKTLVSRKSQGSSRADLKPNCKGPPEQNQKPVRKWRKRRRSLTRPAPFPPRRLDVLPRSANIKEKRGSRAGSFCPFVHVEKRSCTVVNHQEEQAMVGGQQRSSATSLSGDIPSTSCFQLGRSSSESSVQALLCCLCGQTANAMSLGDLHGPYHPTSPSVDQKNQLQEQLQEQQQNEAKLLLVKIQAVNSTGDGCHGDHSSLPKAPPRLHECWIHEDCGIWSTGVFLVRGRLYGLEEAARLAQETVCSSCQKTGAIMGCFQKGCPRNYHFRCSVQSGCVLNEDNFSLRCPEHKNKLLTSTTRQHKR